MTVEHRTTEYRRGAVLVAVAVGGTFAGAFTHVTPVTAFAVLPVYLAGAGMLLGEAQLWSETHTAPRGLLAVGFTRVPVAALLVIVFVVSSYRFTDGSAHAVY